jgi:hypothetical protein
MESVQQEYGNNTSGALDIAQSIPVELCDAEQPDLSSLSPQTHNLLLQTGPNMSDDETSNESTDNTISSEDETEPVPLSREPSQSHIRSRQLALLQTDCGFMRGEKMSETYLSTSGRSLRRPKPLATELPKATHSTPSVTTVSGHVCPLVLWVMRFCACMSHAMHLFKYLFAAEASFRPLHTQRRAWPGF